MVTNSLLSDYDTSDPYQESSKTAESVLTRTLINWQHSVYFLTAQNTLSPFNETDPSIVGFTNIAAVSNGEYIYTGGDSSAAGSAFASVFKYNFYPETIAVRRGFDCSTSATFDVTVGPYDSGLFVYTTGKGITLNMNGAAVAANATFGNLQIFKIDTNTSTSLTISGQDKSCSYRAFTSSSEAIVLGYSKNFNLIDVSTSYLTTSIPTNPVARIVSSGSYSSLMLIAVPLNDPTTTMNNLGSVTPDNNVRSDCNFPLHFTQWKSDKTGPFAAVLTLKDDATVPRDTVRIRPGAIFSPSWFFYINYNRLNYGDFQSHVIQ